MPPAIALALVTVQPLKWKSLENQSVHPCAVPCAIPQAIPSSLLLSL